jgi:hypothetical protein
MKSTSVRVKELLLGLLLALFAGFATVACTVIEAAPPLEATPLAEATPSVAAVSPAEAAPPVAATPPAEPKSQSVARPAAEATPQTEPVPPVTHDEDGLPRALIGGLRVHAAQDGSYSFVVPLNWQEFVMTDREGIVLSPEGDPRTGFYFSVRELDDDSDEPISEDKLLAWYESITEALKALPDAEILEEKRISKESATGFEYLLTFSEDGALCKRRMRWLFHGKQLFILYGQAVPVEDYDVFHNAFEYIYSSFTLGDVRDKIQATAPGY